MNYRGLIINAFSIPPTCNFGLSAPLTTLPITHTGRMLVSTYSGNNVSGRTPLWSMCVKGETSLLFREYRLPSCTQKPRYHRRSIDSGRKFLFPTYTRTCVYFFPLTTLVNEPNIGFLSDEKRRIGLRGCAYVRTWDVH